MAKAVQSIAIVDDDVPILRSMRRFLRGRGYAPRTYETAQEFLATVGEGVPDCLIIDLQMPGMTGLELHQHLADQGLAIPTIFISAHGDHGVAERRCSTGDVAFLSKPVQISLLMQAIASMTGDKGPS